MRCKHVVGFGLLILLGLFIPFSAPDSTEVAAASPDALTWQIDVIDATNNVGMTPSLSLQPGTEKPYISYYDNSLGDLKLAFPVTSGGDCGPGNSWSCNSLTHQNNTDFGLHSSLAFTSLGQWGIAYQNATSGLNEFRGIPAPTGGEIYYAPIEQPANVFAVFNNMRYGSNDVSHVSYGLVDVNQAKGFIKHARYVGQFGNCGNGLWQCESIIQTSLTGFTLYNSLALYGNLPYVFYRDINHHLSMAVNVIGNCGTTNDWDCIPVDTNITVNGQISSYVNASDDFLGVAYIGNSSLRYAYLVGAGEGNCGGDFYEFRCLIIDSVGSADNNLWLATSLGYYNGQPVIAYTDTNDRTSTVLKIAYPQTNGNCGPLDSSFRHTWRCEVVDSVNGNDLGYFPSLQVDTQGNIHIAYYDFTAGNLKYAVTETEIPINLTDIYLPLTVR